MKFRQVAVLLAGSFAFADAIAAQTAAVSDDDAPVLAEAQPVMPDLEFFAQQAPPDAPSASALPQSDAAGDRYRVEIELLAQSEHQFVRCKLKSGKVLTGRLRDRGETTFAVRTNALGDGTLVEYKDLAEMPRAVPAVGTRIKQGAQITGFVIFVVVFFIPLALTGAIPSC
jgi:hypothetical protein